MEKEILENVKEANKKLDTLLQWRAGLEERCKAHLEKTQEVRTVLFANPGGVVERVNRLSQCKKSMTHSTEFWFYILKVVIAAAIISLTTWLLSIYREQGNENERTSIVNTEEQRKEM